MVRQPDLRVCRLGRPRAPMWLNGFVEGTPIDAGFTDGGVNRVDEIERAIS